MSWSNKAYRNPYTQARTSAHACPRTIPDVTEDSETGSGLRSSRDNGIFDQIRANDAVGFCFGSETDGRRTGRSGSFDAEMTPP